MNRNSALLLLGVFAATVPYAAPAAAADDERWLDAYRAPAARIVQEALANTTAWERLTELTDTFGPRFSGSPQLEQAIRWTVEQMERDGLEGVRAESVKVPRWVRGRESATLVEPAGGELVMLGLGNSVGTPPAGIEAELLVVKSFDELEARSAEARGRIVLFNVPYTGYGPTVRYRGTGASRAARHGAVAMLLRSVGLPGLRTPHTGALRYEDAVPKIPAAAIALEDAERLQRLQDRGRRVVVRLKMEAAFQPDADSANVIAELRGRETPGEVVLLGGHIDSWDVGTGAMDDAGGCVVTWEAVRLLKALGLRPRRTLRVVLWTNEENGLRGAHAYRDQHGAELAGHVLALESDSGVFRPTGFGFTGSDAARATLQEIATLLEGLGAARIGASGGGADTGPLREAAGVPTMSLDVDGSRYFQLHHTPADTIDQLDPADVARCVAAVAVMVYVVADMPRRLGVS
jgi:carboxypeptidase Q